MLRINLLDLDRQGSVRVKREIPTHDSLLSDLSLDPVDPVGVDLKVTATPTGQVVAQGVLRVRLQYECRRCLEPVERSLDEEVTLVWVPGDELSRSASEDESVGEGDLRVLDLTLNELDLAEAVREELILSAPRFVLCREDCRGLCPRCGINRNDETCECTLEEPDPRWDALRALKEE